MSEQPQANAGPTRVDTSGQGRWCEEHGRWECVKRAKKGGLCHGLRILGLDRCRMHAGQSGALARTRGEASLRRATYGLPREVDPGQALLEEVHRTAGHVAWLAMRVRDLEESELVWGVVEEVDRPAGEKSLGGVETKSKAVPHAYVTLYQQERDRLARVAKAAIDAGVSERVVAVYEQVATAYVQMWDRVLDRLDLSAAQRARVPEVVQGELRAIAGGVS